MLFAKCCVLRTRPLRTHHLRTHHLRTHHLRTHHLRTRYTQARLLYLLVASLLVTCSSAQAQHQATYSDEDSSQHERRQQTVGEALDQHLSRLEAFGLSGAVLVARDDAVILKKGYGQAHRAENVPVTAQTPFVIGSLSKQFTAAAVLALWEDGRLALA